MRRQLTITLVFVVVGVLFASTLPVGILAADGDLDLSFGSGGKVTTDFMEGSSAASDLALQSDGKFIAVGSVGQGSSRDFALARYNSDGSLDTSFGSGGTVTTHFFGSSDQALAVALQSDGKIIAVGQAVQSDGDDDFALARYNSDGSLDTSFGTGGKVTTDFFSQNDQAFAVALQSDGKIIAAGSTFLDFALARYNSDGSLDATFGSGGKVTTDFAFSDQAFAVALQSDGKIIAAGFANQGRRDINDFALARYNSDGSLDTRPS